MYALVENNVPRKASYNAIRDHLKLQGSNPSRETFNRWSEVEKNGFGIFTIVDIKAPLDKYQYPVEGPLAFDGVRVTRTFTATDIDLGIAKGQAVVAMLAKQDQALTSSTFAMPDGTAVSMKPETRSLVGRGATSGKSAIKWRVYNIGSGSWEWKTLTKPEVAAISDAIDDKIEAIQNNAEALEIAINQAADLAALRAIDINTGW